jgi:hypothetical protein
LVIVRRGFHNLIRKENLIPRSRLLLGDSKVSRACATPAGLYVDLIGMTRDHPFANTPSGQHPLPRGGLGVVAHAHKYSLSPAITPELGMERVLATPPQRKRTNTLVKRTPGKPPIPVRAVPTLPQSPEQSSPPPIPLSTAPARLYKGKGGRERVGRRTALNPFRSLPYI